MTGSRLHEKESVKDDVTCDAGKVCTYTLLMTMCSYIESHAKHVNFRCQLLSILVELCPGSPDTNSDFGRLLLLEIYHLAKYFVLSRQQHPNRSSRLAPSKDIRM